MLLAAVMALTVAMKCQSAAADNPLAPQGVTVTENDSAFTLSNGIVTAKVSKRSGDLTSLVYTGIETLASDSGHAGGYWSHDATGGADLKTAVTIDPKSNEGHRGEVSVKGISGGKKMGHGAGAAADGNFPADIEIRYSLGTGDSGVYTYCIFDHRPEYPAGSMGEARYCAKLADCFDWMTLDAKRSMKYPKELHEGDKYIYTAVQADHPAYGWSSTTKNIGFWLLNPSVEYLSGGPTKVEFLCHRDTTPVAAPCVHNYWRSSHYGGAYVEVAKDEKWKKVIGPFFLYVNSGNDPTVVFNDALAQQAKEGQKWPYEWVAGVDYPRQAERSTVRGQLILNDSQAPSAKLPNLMVGLTTADYQVPSAGPGGGAGRIRPINWQVDAKHYEFWAHGDADGRFSIPNVRPGVYTLRAFADGVLGEFAKAEVIIPAKIQTDATNLQVEPTTIIHDRYFDLGKLDWQPVRHGKQLWEIGIPNRTATEFFKAEEVNDPEISLKYTSLFPNDVNYTIGKSDFHKDWFFQHVPHSEDPNAKSEPYYGVRSNGRATPYSISFDLKDVPHGTATLRIALCGTGARAIEISLNDKPLGQIDRMLGDGAITRHSVQGLWYERELAFDAAQLKAGTNVLKLTIPAGQVNNGVIYDYLRLELDEGKPAPTTAATAQ
ncbi:MAG TPA: polysaccharide lyase family 4 protein [Pirellulales bacterium]|jgi:rhamnogalacturonan endolyase